MELVAQEKVLEQMLKSIDRIWTQYGGVGGGMQVLRDQVQAKLTRLRNQINRGA